jgi:all-trans-retinol 13,14-reductase
MRNGRSHHQHPVSGSWDVIIVGSGIGGLAAAGLLARHAGKRVLVLERHYTAGGFTHSFTRRGFEWDVGVHYIGQVERRTAILRRLFDHLSDGALEWADLGEVVDTIVIDGERYPLPRGRRAYRDFLVGRFPGTARVIDAYLERTRAAVRQSRGFFVDKALPDLLSRAIGPALRFPALRHARRTVAEVLDELGVDDPRLRGVLTAQWGDYGLPPGQASFIIHAMVVEHYLGGASYPVGGAGRIAATIIPGIERGGGAVVTSAEVERILVRDGRAAGVRLVDGTELTAPVVVSDAGWALTASRLLAPEDAARAGMSAALPGVAPSVGHVSLYVGANGDAAELGLRRSNVWVYPGHDHDAQVARYAADPDAPLPLAYLSFPSAKDPDFARRHPGKATVEVVGIAPYARFAGWEQTRWHRRGDDYEALKAQLSERLLDVLLRECPSLRGRLEHVELSTPLSTRNFAAHPHGEIYGLAHVPARFAARALRPETRLPGLYLAGADLATAGVAGALVGGALAAVAIARRDLLGSLLRARTTVSAPRARGTGDRRGSSQSAGRPAAAPATSG